MVRHKRPGAGIVEPLFKPYFGAIETEMLMLAEELGPISVSAVAGSAATARTRTAPIAPPRLVMARAAESRLAKMVKAMAKAAGRHVLRCCVTIGQLSPKPQSLVAVPSILEDGRRPFKGRFRHSSALVREGDLTQN